MAIHVDVLAKVNDRQVKSEASKLADQFDDAGRLSANKFGTAFEAGMSRNSPKIQKAFNDVNTATERADDAMRAYMKTMSSAKATQDDVTRATTRLEQAKRKEADAHRNAAAAIRSYENDLKRMNAQLEGSNDLFNETTEAITDFGRVARGLGSAAIPGAVLAFAPAVLELVGAVGNLSQSVLLLPAAATMAAAGFGTLKLATMGFGDAIKDIGDPKKFAEDLQSLSPNAQQAALSIQQLIPALTELKNQTQDSLFAGVGQELNALTQTFMPTIDHLTTSVASSFNAMFMNLGQELMTPALQGDITIAVDNITDAFHNLEPAIRPIVQALGDLTAAGSDFLPGLAEDIADSASEFANFIDEARKSGDLKVWIGQGITAVKTLGDVLYQAGRAIMALSGEDAQNALQGLADMLSAVADNMKGILTTARLLRDISFPLVGALDALGLLDDKNRNTDNGDSGRSNDSGVGSLFGGPSALPWSSPDVPGWGGPFPVPPAPPKTTVSDKDRRDAISAGLDPSLYAVDPNKPFAGASGPMPGGGYGGTTAHQQDILDAQHKVESEAHDLSEATRERLTLERDNQATQKEVDDAKWKEIEAGWAFQKAQADLAEKIRGTTKVAKDGMDQLGAALDPDLGLSKGLPGLADNLVRMLGNIVAAPELAKLQGTVNADPTKGGFGLMGILGAQNQAAGLSPLLGRPTSAGGAYASGSAASAPGLGMAGVPNQAGTGQSITGRSVYNGPHTEDTGGKVVPNVANAEALIKQMFPGVSINNDYRPQDGYNEHSSGQAIDFSINPGGAMGSRTAAGQAQGAALKDFLIENAKSLGLNYALWDQTQFNPNGSSSGMEDRKGVTANHGDHVHAEFAPGPAAGGGYGGAGGAMPNAGGGGLNWDALAAKESSGNWGINTGNGYSGGLQFDPSTWAQYGGTQYAPSAGQASKDQQIATAQRAYDARGGGASLWPQNYGQLQVPTANAAGGTGGAGLGPMFPQPPDPFASLDPNSPVGATAPPVTGVGPFATPAGVTAGGIGSSSTMGLAGGGAGGGWSPASSGAAGGGATTKYGGVEPGVPLGGSGGIGMQAGGLLDTALSTATSGLDVLAPGAGQAAQVGIKLANRAIQQAGQYAGIGLGGLMETFLPTGGSELANSGWIPRIVGGLAGAKPALPNIAGGTGGGKPDDAPPPLDPNQVTHQGTGAAPGPGGNVNVNYTSVGQTEDRNGKDLAFHLGQSAGGARSAPARSG